MAPQTTAKYGAHEKTAQYGTHAKIEFKAYRA
jgi:hypothetical protein